MTGSVNKVTLIGHLGADPEIRNLANGNMIATLRMATSESWLDKSSGEKKERTEWHRIVIFNEGLAGVAEQYLKKGSQVYIEGQLQTRKWQDQNGNDRYTTEVVLQGFRAQLVMLGGKDEAQAPKQAQAPRQAQARSKAQAKPKPSLGEEMDDEIPF